MNNTMLWPQKNKLYTTDVNGRGYTNIYTKEKFPYGNSKIESNEIVLILDIDSLKDVAKVFYKNKIIYIPDTRVVSFTLVETNDE